MTAKEKSKTVAENWEEAKRENEVLYAKEALDAKGEIAKRAKEKNIFLWQEEEQIDKKKMCDIFIKSWVNVLEDMNKKGFTTLVDEYADLAYICHTDVQNIYMIQRLAIRMCLDPRMMQRNPWKFYFTLFFQILKKIFVTSMLGSIKGFFWKNK